MSFSILFLYLFQGARKTRGKGEKNKYTSAKAQRDLFRQAHCHDTVYLYNLKSETKILPAYELRGRNREEMRDSIFQVNLRCRETMFQA